MSTPEIVTRAGWGAASASTSNRSSTIESILHHTTGATLGTPADEKRWVKDIQTYHMKTLGWSDIGYCALVGASGILYEGRGWNKQGAHCSGHNSQSFGIAFLGDGNKVTDAAKATLKWAMDKYAPGKRVVPHRDYGSTACPSDKLTQWVRDGCPAGGVSPTPTPPSAPRPGKWVMAIVPRAASMGGYIWQNEQMGLKLAGVSGDYDQEFTLVHVADDSGRFNQVLGNLAKMGNDQVHYVKPGDVIVLENDGNNSITRY